MSYAALYIRSMLVLTMLFTMLLAASAAIGALGDMSFNAILLLAAVLMVINFLVAPLLIDWIYGIQWVGLEELGPGLAAWVKETCERHGKPVPRFGVIEDGNPNAFTYGNWPGNARLVITRGLLDVLDEDELKTVVAHEMGHVFHYDFIVMTVAGFIPLALYYLYNLASRLSRGGNRNSRGAAATTALVCLVLFYVSHYIVLFLSRTREYFADAFAGKETGRPDRLGTALVKIAYGLVAAQDRAAAAARESGEKARPRPVVVGNALGIFDSVSARAVATASQVGWGKGDAFNKAARWELWNPWAWIYELNSTHPLVAKRIRNLSLQAEEMGLQPFYSFTEEKPESFWDEFLGDVVVNYLPLLTFAAGVVLAVLQMAPLGGGVWGVGLLIATFFRYRSGFAPAQVVDLLGQVKVSEIRPCPAVIEGRIIGRGEPGFFLSEDLVLQDDTGYIILDYRQPGRVFDWFFALFRARKLVGGKARVTGWYRRAPVPYFEVRKLEMEDGTTHTSYVFPARIALAVVAPLILVGLGILMQG